VLRVPLLKPKLSLWCNDEKARSARRRGVGVLPCRRGILHAGVRDLRSGTLCNHGAVITDACQYRRAENDDRVLHTCRNSQHITLRLYRHQYLLSQHGQARCGSVPVWHWPQPQAYTQRDFGRLRTYCYGICKFHRDDAGMGFSIEHAERGHLSSVLAFHQHPGMRLGEAVESWPAYFAWGCFRDFVYGPCAAPNREAKLVNNIDQCVLLKLHTAAAGPSAIGCGPCQNGHAGHLPSKHPKVVRAGNIGKFSLVSRHPSKGLSLQARSMTDDDLEAAFAASGRPRSSLSGGPERARNAKVTIYSGRDCKLCEVVREGELLER